MSVTKFTRKQVEDSKGFNDAQKRKVLTNVARLLQIDKYSFTTVDGHMAISYTGRDSEDSSVIMRREVVYSSAGLYGLESFGTSSSEYKQFVDTFRLSEDTQEWKEGLHDFRHWLYLLPGDARPGLDGSRHGGRDRSGHHRRDRRRHLRHQILANTLQGMVGLRSLYTDEVVDSHQIMMMNDYMPTKVNDLYKALLSLG